MTKTNSKSTKIVAKKAASASSKIKITPKEQAILNAIATLKARNKEKGAVDRAMTFKLCGYSKNKGAKAFANLITILKKHKKLIVFDSTTMDLTEAGEKLAEVTEASPPSLGEQVDKVKADLKKGGNKAKEMLDLLRDGNVHSRVDIAEAMGYENAKVKSFVNLMSFLKGEDIIQYAKDSSGNPGLQLAEWILN